MKVHLSAAVTADGALDDCTALRLRISDEADWAAVERLRARCDAILVGAETVRRDNPRLVLPEALRSERLRRGASPDPVRITVTRTGCLDPGARIFTCGEGPRIVFAERPVPRLAGVAETIVTGRLTMSFVVTELEKRGIGDLLVEGGAQVLRGFLVEGLADTLRLASRPSLRVADDRAPRFPFDALPAGVSHRDSTCGALHVAEYTLRPDRRDEDLPLLRQAVELSRRCEPCGGSYRVGAVVVTCDGARYTGYTHESSATHHAEQEAVAKAIAAGASLRGATVYSSMEPCSKRASEPESCSAMLLRLGVARVVFALYEPDRFVRCRGALDLREGGVEVTAYPELADEVLRVNAHLGISADR